MGQNKDITAMLSQLVAERGYIGFKYRYREIAKQIIDPNSVYENLSDENKDIIHKALNLSEENLKQISALLYSKNESEGTKIGFVLGLLSFQCSGADKYTPLPEEARQTPLDEYIDFLKISHSLLYIYLDPRRADTIGLELRHAIKNHILQNYKEPSFNGLLTVFNGFATFDKTLYNIARHLEELKLQDEAMRGNIFLEGHHWPTIAAYNQYRGCEYSCRNITDFRKNIRYIDFSFPLKDIISKFSSDETYKSLYNNISVEELQTLDKEKKDYYRTEVEELRKKLHNSMIPNSGIEGQWRRTLASRLDDLISILRKAKSKSPNNEYNDKLRLYLLRQITSPLQERAKSLLHRLYAAILNSNEGVVRSNSERLDRSDLGYEDYNARARNLEKAYRLIKDINDKSPILQNIIEDLIPNTSTKEGALRKFDKCRFSDHDLEQKIQIAISQKQYKNSETPND